MEPNLRVVVSSIQELADPSRYATEKLYHISGNLSKEIENRRTNIHYVVRNGVCFHDLRGTESSLDLDRDGFCYKVVPHSLDVDSDEDLNGNELLQQYIVDCLAFLKVELGAEHIVCYDYFFRRTKNAFIQAGKVQGSGTLLDPGTGVNQPHVDLTPTSGPIRVQRHLTPAELTRYQDGNWRIRIINAWIPVHRAVETSPLAFCDFRTIKQEDLFPCDRVTEDFVGETYHLQHDPAQRWYWLSEQTPHEMALFVCYDSEPGAPFIPHVAFPLESAGARPRESIEMRLIVVTPKN
ncbi:hypothetical protein BDW74DRAFT_161297 [Aspergillus multicolor]|uniref:uncharacterized protein n=1 Tax=Aspergillus multicolor TaxID=41759 RepID=UPI003CCCD36B